MHPHIAPAKGSFNVRYLLSLLRVARQHRTDVIVAHLYGSMLYASLAGAILSIPVVSVLHGQTDVPQSDRFTALKSAIIRKVSRRIIFVSKALESHLRPKLGLTAAQCAVIANGVDTDVFKPSRNQSLRSELGLSDETILIGAIGNVRPPKAYDVLLKAARMLINRSQRYHFAIAGDCGNSLGRQLEQLRRDLGLDRHVTFLGLRMDVAQALNSLDVFVLSSHTEGFSIACIEAMACGIPVVATRSGGPEQILEGGVGTLVPTGDPQSLALAIERVASSKDLTKTLADKALIRVRQEYSLTRMLARYADVLEQVVHEARK